MFSSGSSRKLDNTKQTEENNLSNQKHIRILELIEDKNLYSFEDILKELLAFLPEGILENFYQTAFGNVGLEPEISEEELENLNYKEIACLKVEEWCRKSPNFVSNNFVRTEYLFFDSENNISLVAEISKGNFMNRNVWGFTVLHVIHNSKHLVKKYSSTYTKSFLLEELFLIHIAFVKTELLLNYKPTKLQTKN